MIAQEPVALSSPATAPGVCIRAVDAGEWISPELLRSELLAAEGRGEEARVDTAFCPHLSCGILQVLLAWSGAPQGERAQRLVLTSVSPELSQWLELAGAGHLLALLELEARA